MTGLIQISTLRVICVAGAFMMPHTIASSLEARATDASAALGTGDPPSRMGGIAMPEAEVVPASARTTHRILMVANGASSIFASLNQLRYLEVHSGKRIGDLFDGAAGGSLAGSFLAAAIFMRDKEGKYLTVSAIHTFIHEHFDAMTSLNAGCCFWRPRNIFNGDSLMMVLNRFFADKKLSDLGDKKLIVPLRVKGTTSDFMASSHDLTTGRGEDFYLKDLVRAASSTKGYFRSVRTVSLAGKAHRFGDLWPSVQDATLPVMLKLTREFSDATYSNYHVLSVGKICAAKTPSDDDSILRDRMMDEALIALLGDRFVRPCIAVTEQQSSPFMVAPSIVRRLIHASNPEDKTNRSQKELLDRYLGLIGEKRPLPRRVISTALIVDGGRIIQVPELLSPPARPSVAGVAGGGGSETRDLEAPSSALSVVMETATEHEDGVSIASGKSALTERSIAPSLSSGEEAPPEI